MAIGLNNDTFVVNLSDESVQQIGSIIASTRHIAPTGYLLCDGSNTVSRTAYSNLFNVIVPNKGAITITSANPGVVTLNTHNFLTGESIFLTSTGALPTNLTANTLYYVINVDANTFRLATTYDNAIGGTAINATTGTQSGTHTLFYCPYGLGNNTNTFKLPDFKNATIRGRGLSTGFTNNDTTRMGNLENDSVQGHRHNRRIDGQNEWSINTSSVGSYTVYTGGYFLSNETTSGQPTTDGTNGTPRTTTETRMKNQGVNFFIKF